MKKILIYIFAILFITTLIHYERESHYNPERTPRPAFDSSLYERHYVYFSGLSIAPYLGIGRTATNVTLKLPLWKMENKAVLLKKKNTDSLFIAIDSYTESVPIFSTNYYKAVSEEGITVLLKRNSWGVLILFYCLTIISMLALLFVLRSVIFVATEILNEEPFSNNILFRLKLCYSFTGCFPLVFTVVSLITGAFFCRDNYNLIYFDWWQAFTTARTYWFISFAFFCLYHAFKKGFLLKQQQDLTI